MLKNNLAKNVLTYAIGGAIGPAIPFFLLPVMTKYLSPSDYGILSILTAFQSISLYIISFNQHSAYTRFFYDNEGQNTKLLMMNNTFVITIIFIIFILITSTSRNFHNIFIQVDKVWIYLMVFIAYAGSLELLLKTHMQIANKPKTYVFINVGSALIIALITLYLVVSKSFLWQGKVYSMLIYFTLFLIVFLAYLISNDNFSLNFNLDIFKETTRFGAGLLIGSIAGWGLNMSDRFLISGLLNVEDVGKYTVAHQFGYVVFIIVASIGKAWSPYFWKNFLKKGDEGKDFIIKNSRYIFLLVILITFLIINLSPFLMEIMVDKQYHESKSYVKWIALGYGIQGIQVIFIQYITFHKKTHFLSFITLLTLIIKLITSYSLINIFGVIGAAWSTFICFLFPTLGIIIYSAILEKEHVFKLFNLNINRML